MPSTKISKRSKVISEPEPIVIPDPAVSESTEASQSVVAPKTRKPRAKKEVIEGGSLEPKAKRVLPEALRVRSEFFKEHYATVRDLPNSERFKRLSELFKESKQ